MISTKEGWTFSFVSAYMALDRRLAYALDRLNRSCEVYIHTEDHFVLRMLENNLEKWAENNYMGSKGPIKHAELWEEIYERIQGQEIYTEEGRHTYSQWLEDEMKRREKDD